MSGVAITLCAGTFLAAAAGYAYMKRPGMPWYVPTLSDKAIHGEYVGISPLLAARGASLEESTVRFAIDGSGVFLDTTLEFDGAKHAFRTHYPASWVFNMQGWGVGHTLAVRQYETSKLASVIISFTSRSLSGTQSDAIMILGEGMPAPLGVFVRRKEGRDTQKELIALHARFFTPTTQQEEHSYLQPIDMVTATVAMAAGTVEERLAILKDARSNMWTGTDQEIKERLSLIAMGLRDDEADVQKEALTAFVFGGRVTGGVALVTEFLASPVQRRRDVAEKAIEAATCLLYETHSFNKDVALLMTAFGTSEPGAIHQKTGGLLTPAQFESLQQIANSRPQRRWTLEHQQVLRDAIASTIAHRDTPPDALREGERALKEFPLVAAPM